MHDEKSLLQELLEARERIAELEERLNETESRCSELEQEAQQRFREFVEKTPAGICITDENGFFEYVNPAYCEIYQYTEEELIGKHFTIVVPESARDALSQRHEAFIAGKGEIRGEWSVLRKDGTELTILADAARLNGEHGKFRKATFVQDITDRKLLEVMRERVGRITRHDLKTPLNGIINIPDFLLSSYDFDEEQRNFLQLIREAGVNMLESINLSHNLIKMETNSYILQPVSLDLKFIVARILRDLGSLLKGKKLDVCIDWGVEEKEPFTVHGEELLCYSMLANLLKNAAEASPDNATLSIRGKMDVSRGMSCLALHNEGAVPLEVRDVFFDMYSTHGKREGMGLGTYSARLIAETQKGTISMRTSEEEGTTVTICLPLP